MTDSSGLLWLALLLLAALWAKRWAIIDAPFIMFPVPMDIRDGSG